MVESSFSPEAWVDAVHRACAGPGAARDLNANGLDLETVLNVAAVESSQAEANGITSLSHDQLAELAGVSRFSACRARLVLIDLGLQSLEARSGAAAGVHRVLHLRHA
jgi:hypothetical protein